MNAFDRPWRTYQTWMLPFKSVLLTASTMLTFVGVGQTNLVPNFGFEEYSNCPSTEDQVSFCEGWSKYSASSTTPDFYNSCSPYFYSVPQNQAQFQIDHRGCGAYMGCITWSGITANYREHIGVQLSQPLVVGQKYFLSFYTVLGGQTDGTDYYDNPSNNIGLRLSTVPYSSSNPAPIDNFAHIRSVTILNDTANWIHVTGSIVADSAYSYLILGNFYNDTNTDTTTLTCGTCQNWYSYYLIDDVCVSTDSIFCNGGINSVPCTVSIEESHFQSQIEVFPNPTTDLISINTVLNSPFCVEIYNSVGQLIYEKQNISSNSFDINSSHFPSGLLFVKIKSNKNQVIHRILKL